MMIDLSSAEHEAIDRQYVQPEFVEAVTKL